MFSYSTEELYSIERMFENIWGVSPAITRELIFEFLDLRLHDFVEKRRRKIDPAMVTDWGVHKEIIIIYLTIRMMKPKVIVETGTGVGISDAYILQALARNGVPAEFHSLGVQSLNLRDFPIAYCVPDELRYHSFVKYTQYPVVIQRAVPELLDDLGDVDIFFHDSDHCGENMYWELEQALPHSDILFVHDVHTNDAFLRFIEDYGLRGVMFERKDPVRSILGVIF